MNENSYDLNSAPYHKLNFVASTKNIPIHSQRNVLPKQYAVDLGILKGDFVKVQEEEGRIIIQKA